MSEPGEIKLSYGETKKLERAGEELHPYSIEEVIYQLDYEYQEILCHNKLNSKGMIDAGYAIDRVKKLLWRQNAELEDENAALLSTTFIIKAVSAEASRHYDSNYPSFLRDKNYQGWSEGYETAFVILRNYRGLEGKGKSFPDEIQIDPKEWFD